MLGIMGCVLLLIALICLFRGVQLCGFVEAKEDISEARRKPEFQLSIVFGAGALICITAAVL